MKNLKRITLVIALFLAGAYTSCKKGDDQGPDDNGENGQLINSARLFFNDNSSIVQEGNDVVIATYADNKLNVNFSQNGTEVALEIPNYDIRAEQTDYTNATAALNIKKASKTYNSAFIFIPVIVGNPPYPVFVQDKSMLIKANNLQVNDHTTDISIQITAGSELITAPVSNGSDPVYDDLAFVQGAGGKPNMINIRIKQ